MSVVPEQAQRRGATHTLADGVMSHMFYLPSSENSTGMIGSDSSIAESEYSYSWSGVCVIAVGDVGSSGNVECIASVSQKWTLDDEKMKSARLVPV